MTNKAPEVSCEPHTIWALEEHQRSEAVIALVKECASNFQDALRQNGSDAAQDCVIGALGAIAGLFSPDEEATHEFLLSIVAVFMGAKAGRTDHILLKRTDAIPGIKRGFGHNNVAGFAIAAFRILTERGLLTDRGARQQVAKWLADAGLSLRTRDHGESIPITGSAVREWLKYPASFPIPHAIAADMRKIFEGHLAARFLTTLPEVSSYLADQAKHAFRRSQLM